MSAIYLYLEDLFKQPHTFPTIIVTVSIAVLIVIVQDQLEKREEKRQRQQQQEQQEKEDASKEDDTSGSAAPRPKAFALPTTPLPPPDWSRNFTSEELSKHDGTEEDKPIYVAIKSTVFDVSTKKTMYGPSGGYHCFAGKDASKRKTLDDWYSFFEKRYPIVGKTTNA
ncbi:hypothetical protein BGX34_005394 [Mortierella sp. NVP85]|nr:hypothetical protein BGX34_005394 [Mortierella sp. NVP85]